MFFFGKDQFMFKDLIWPYLQIALCGEGSTADRAGEWFFSRVCALMDLQGAGGGEVFPT